jgi:hypothetical protein
MSVNIVYSLPSTQKDDQYLNSNELLLKITFNFVTFADFMTVPIYVIAVDYDRYAILKYCFFHDSKRKFVPLKVLNVLRIDRDK